MIIFDPATMQKNFWSLSTNNTKKTKKCRVIFANRIPSGTMPKDMLSCLITGMTVGANGARYKLRPMKSRNMIKGIRKNISYQGLM